jgi:hypothetical protein
VAVRVLFDQDGIKIDCDSEDRHGGQDKFRVTLTDGRDMTELHFSVSMLVVDMEGVSYAFYNPSKDGGAVYYGLSYRYRRKGREVAERIAAAIREAD